MQSSDEIGVGQKRPAEGDEVGVPRAQRSLRARPVEPAGEDERARPRARSARSVPPGPRGRPSPSDRRGERTGARWRQPRHKRRVRLLDPGRPSCRVHPVGRADTNIVPANRRGDRPRTSTKANRFSTAPPQPSVRWFACGSETARSGSRSPHAAPRRRSPRRSRPADWANSSTAPRNLALAHRSGTGLGGCRPSASVYISPGGDKRRRRDPGLLHPRGKFATCAGAPGVHQLNDNFPALGMHGIGDQPPATDMSPP